MATKQKENEKNGMAQAQTIDLEAAQQLLNNAEIEKRERFQLEYARLCDEYGYEITARPAFSDDGRIGVALGVRKRG